jgi:hypothetical protein
MERGWSAFCWSLEAPVELLQHQLFGNPAAQETRCVGQLFFGAIDLVLLSRAMVMPPEVPGMMVIGERDPGWTERV